jgi:hypothetical protein
LFDKAISICRRIKIFMGPSSSSMMAIFVVCSFIAMLDPRQSADSAPAFREEIE